MDEFNDDMNDIHPFVDPALLIASRNNQTQVPKLQLNQDSDRQAYIEPSSSAPAFQSQISADMDALNKKEEQLKKWQQDLALKEQNLSRAAGQNRPRNFPPLPDWFPIRPCFYIDIDEEIPEPYKKLAKHLYYKLMAYSVILILNVIVLSTALGSGIDGIIVDFVTALVFFPVFVFLSFIFCFRATYIALRSNSSFYYYVGLICYAFETFTHFIQLCGFKSLSWAGFLLGANLFEKNKTFSGVLFIIMGLSFTGMLVISAFLWHQIYLSFKISGANFNSARNEFNSNIFNIGTQAAQAAASSSIQQNQPSLYSS